MPFVTQITSPVDAASTAAWIVALAVAQFVPAAASLPFVATCQSAATAPTAHMTQIQAPTLLTPVAFMPLPRSEWLNHPSAPSYSPARAPLQALALVDVATPTGLLAHRSLGEGGPRG